MRSGKWEVGSGINREATTETLRPFISSETPGSGAVGKWNTLSLSLFPPLSFSLSAPISLNMAFLSASGYRLQASGAPGARKFGVACQVADWLRG